MFVQHPCNQAATSIYLYSISTISDICTVSNIFIASNICIPSGSCIPSKHCLTSACILLGTCQLVFVHHFSLYTQSGLCTPLKSVYYLVSIHHLAFVCHLVYTYILSLHHSVMLYLESEQHLTSICWASVLLSRMCIHEMKKKTMLTTRGHTRSNVAMLWRTVLTSVNCKVLQGIDRMWNTCEAPASSCFRQNEYPPSTITIILANMIVAITIALVVIVVVVNVVVVVISVVSSFLGRRFALFYIQSSNFITILWIRKKLLVKYQS